MRRGILGVCGAAMLALTGAAPAPPTVFAYSPSLVLDFGRGLEVYADVERSKISDCSSRKIQCVSGNVVRAAWRTECIQVKGYEAKVGDIVSVVRDTYIERRHISAAQVAIVTTADRPHAAYLIMDGGLVGVIVDQTRSGKLSGLIDDGTVKRSLQAGEERPSFGLVNRLLTLDAFGSCRTPRTA